MICWFFKHPDSLGLRQVRGNWWLVVYVQCTLQFWELSCRLLFPWMYHIPCYFLISAISWGHDTFIYIFWSLLWRSLWLLVRTLYIYNISPWVGQHWDGVRVHQALLVVTHNFVPIWITISFPRPKSNFLAPSGCVIS